MQLRLHYYCCSPAAVQSGARSVAPLVMCVVEEASCLAAKLMLGYNRPINDPEVHAETLECPRD